MVKAFALVFVLTLDKQNAINFQLLGGIWILQTFPAIVFSLYTRWFHRWALLAGWAVGMVYGTVEAWQVVNPVTGNHFGGSLAQIPVIGEMGYIALTAFVHQPGRRRRAHARAQRAEGAQRRGRDDPVDYFADAGDPRVQKDLVEHEAHGEVYGDPDDIPGNARRVGPPPTPGGFGAGNPPTHPPLSVNPRGCSLEP